MHRVTVIFSIVFLGLLFNFMEKASAIRWQASFIDGPCPKKPYKVQQISPIVMDSFKYISAGSKLLMYSGVSQIPNYQDIGEDEFYYDLCLTHNASTLETPTMAVYGFGRILTLFNVTSRPGRYLNVPLDPSLEWMRLRETVTLTDGKTFIFLASCVPKFNLKSWSVNTLGPNTIDENTRKLIEDHAVSLGFNRDNFVFLRYDSCRHGVVVSSPSVPKIVSRPPPIPTTEAYHQPLQQQRRPAVTRNRNTPYFWRKTVDFSNQFLTYN